MTQDTVLEKLGKIKAHMESAKQIGNEAEAQAFAEMLQKLLLKHKLEMTDIEYSSAMKDEPIIEKWPETEYVWNKQNTNRKRVYKDFPDMEVVDRRREWAEQLANIVANAYSCRILVVTGRSIIVFVGHKSNTAMAEYLFLMMLRTAEHLSANAAKSWRAQQRKENGGAGATQKGYRESWLSGFCSRIYTRLKEVRESFNNPTQSTALVRVNKEAIAVRNYMDEKFKDSKGASLSKRRSHYNSDGYGDGVSAANKINLNSPLNAGGANKQLR